MTPVSCGVFLGRWLRSSCLGNTHTYTHAHTSCQKPETTAPYPSVPAWSLSGYSTVHFPMVGSVPQIGTHWASLVNYVGMIIRTGSKGWAQNLHQNLSRRLLRRAWPWTEMRKASLPGGHSAACDAPGGWESRMQLKKPGPQHRVVELWAWSVAPEAGSAVVPTIPVLALESCSNPRVSSCFQGEAVSGKDVPFSNREQSS